MEVKSVTRTCQWCGEEHKPSNWLEFCLDEADTLIWECDCERPTLQ